MRKVWVTGAALAALTGCSVGADVPVARSGAEALHAQLNAGKCTAIREGADDEFKASTPAESWKQVCDQLAAGLGKFVSGKETGWNEEVGTNGKMVRLRLESKFEKNTAAELFLFRIADGKAALVGYHVNSDVFNAAPAPAKPPSPPASPAPK